jgi:hypothetical protein
MYAQAQIFNGLLHGHWAGQKAAIPSGHFMQTPRISKSFVGHFQKWFLSFFSNKKK